MKDAELYIEAGKAGRDAVRSALSATVTAWNASDRTADVQLDVGFWWRDSRGEWREGEPSVLASVPVSMPVAAGRGLVWGLEVGARVLVLVRERSHDELDAGDAGPVVPASRRRFDLADALVLPFPGCRLDIDGDRSDGQPVVLLPSGEALHVGQGSAEGVARGPATDARLSALRGHLDAPGGLLAAWLIGLAGFVAYAAPYPPPPVLATVESGRLKVDG